MSYRGRSWLETRRPVRKRSCCHRCFYCLSSSRRRSCWCLTYLSARQLVRRTSSPRRLCCLRLRSSFALKIYKLRDSGCCFLFCKQRLVVFNQLVEFGFERRIVGRLANILDLQIADFRSVLNQP